MRSCAMNWASLCVPRRIEGGKSRPRTPSSARRGISVGAWTGRQGGFDRLSCALKSASRARGAVYPIASRPRSSSVHGVIAATLVLGWWTRRTGGMKFRDVRWQVHRLENLLSDSFGLDERDKAEPAVALGADDLEPKCFSEKICPRNVLRRTGRLVLFGELGCCGRRHDGTAGGCV
jgi:hypothetical protein